MSISVSGQCGAEPRTAGRAERLEGGWCGRGPGCCGPRGPGVDSSPNPLSRNSARFAAFQATSRSLLPGLLAGPTHQSPPSAERQGLMGRLGWGRSEPWPALAGPSLAVWSGSPALADRFDVGICGIRPVWSCLAARPTACQWQGGWSRWSKDSAWNLDRTGLAGRWP